MLTVHVYEGCRDGQGVAYVHRDGDPFDHRPSLKVYNHSPTGFEWGYAGSGPAQLALAILLDHCAKDVAVELHQRFKFEYVTAFPRSAFRIDSVAVVGWVAETFEEAGLRCV